MYSLSGTYSYTVGTSLPVMPSFTLDLPVGEMARDAAKEMLPWLLLGGFALVFAGAALANYLLPASRKA